MKEGLTLQDMAAELARQNESKVDYLADTAALTMTPEHKLELGEETVLDIAPNGHSQIARNLDIPVKYYNRMMVDSPELLTQNVNHWMHNESRRRTVRTLDNSVRAFLSDRYRPLDNVDLVESIYPVLVEGNAQIVSCNVSDDYLYLKAVIDDVKEEIGPPEGWEWGQRKDVKIDVVQPGLVISNSEVGKGSLQVRPATHTIACSNMAIFSDASLKQNHVGAKLEADVDENWKYLSNQTKRLSDIAIWSQVRDIATAAMDGSAFKEVVSQLRVARGHQITKPVIETIESVSKLYPLAKDEGSSVIAHLNAGGDLSQYGLSNAVTRASADVENYDRATEMEAIGGKIIELNPNQWQTIAAV